MTGYKLCFEETEGKVEYMQRGGPFRCHYDEYGSMIDFDGGLYLENGMWVNYFKCAECDKRFVTYGKFTQEEMEENGT